MSAPSSAPCPGVSPFTRAYPCPVCHGYEEAPRGQGTRCYGFLSSDGRYAHCTREEYAGGILQQANGAFAHRLDGDCRCGRCHGDMVALPPSATHASPLGKGRAVKHAVPIWRDPAERLVATYDYKDTNGRVVLRVQRWEHTTKKDAKGKPRKTFRQSIPNPDRRGGKKWIAPGDALRVPYRLPQLCAAPRDALIYIAEGEKCCDILAAWDFVSTCNPEGARRGSWRPELTQYFAGRDVAIMVDNDPDGERHAQEVAMALHRTASRIRLVRLPGVPDGGDVADFAAAGGTVQALRALVAQTPDWEPEAEQINDEWEEPIPFTRFEGLPEFPVEAFTGWARSMIEAVATAIQTPVELSTMYLLTVVATALQKKVVVTPKPGWSEPVNLFLVVVMGSGENKSTVCQLMAEPLWEWQFAQERQAGDDPDRTHGRLLTNDSTPERLATLMGEHGGKMAVISAEGGIFDVMAGRYSNKVPYIDVYLVGHSGDHYAVDRQGRPSITLRQPALTLGLAVQPKALEVLLGNTVFRGKGLLARFGYMFPSSRVGYRDVDAPPIPSAISDTYKKNVGRLLAVPYRRGQDDNTAPHVLTFSAVAGERFRAMRQQIETRLRPTGDLHVLKDWANKYPGLIARLAGVLHMIELADRTDPWDVNVSEATLNRALAIGEYFQAHAKAAYGEMDVTPGVKDARHVLAWIERESQMRTFTQRVAFRALEGHFDSVERLKPALSMLIERGYIRDVPTTHKGPQGRGRPPGPSYEVNPRVRHRKQPTEQDATEANIVDSVDIVGDLQDPEAVEMETVRV